MIRYSRALIASVALIAVAGAAQAQPSMGSFGDGRPLAGNNLDLGSAAGHLDLYQHRGLAARVGLKRRKSARLALPPLPVRRDHALQPPLPVRGNAATRARDASSAIGPDWTVFSVGAYGWRETSRREGTLNAKSGLRMDA